jgi:hypothetical protein
MHFAPSWPNMAFYCAVLLMTIIIVAAASELKSTMKFFSRPAKMLPYTSHFTSKPSAKAKMSTDLSLTGSHDTHPCNSEDSEDKYTALDALQDEILYIGEGFAEANSAREARQHAMDVLTRHRAIIGGFATAMVIKQAFFTRQASKVAKMAAADFHAAEVAKWGKRL